MKRFFGLCFLLCFLGNAAYSQSVNYRLKYLLSFPYVSDTFIIGKSYAMDIYVVNLDSTATDSFSESFNLAAAYPKNPEDIKSQYINPVSAKAFHIPALNAYGIVQVHSQIVFNHYYKEDSTNIIIVWPVGAYTGSSTVVDLVNDTFGYQLLTLIKDTAHKTAVGPVMNNDSRFTLFPNPASGHIYINANNLHNAAIKIADLQGKILANYTLPSDAGSHNLDIPVTGKDIDLKEGIYLVFIQSDEYTGVKKLLIVR